MYAHRLPVTTPHVDQRHSHPRPLSFYTGKLDDVYQKLHEAHKHMKVYLSKDVPADLHFSENSSRMPPVVVIPDNGWYLAHSEDTRPPGKYRMTGNVKPSRLCNVNLFDNCGGYRVNCHFETNGLVIAVGC